jgi:NAD(P)H-dependent FMN reductase
MKIAVLAGSNHKGSTSTKLSRYIERLLLDKEYDMTFFDVYKQPLTVYNPDIEATTVNELLMVEQLREADAIILSTADYHGGMTGAMKNALDFVGSDEFGGKPVLLVSSAGGPNGMSSLQQMTLTVRHCHGIVCPEWISIGRGQKDFDENGNPVSDKVRERIDNALSMFESMIK